MQVARNAFVLTVTILLTQLVVMAVWYGTPPWLKVAVQLPGLISGIR